MIYDSAGSNNGTIHEALWIEGQLGNALEFDGVDDLVEIPDDDSLTPSHEITVSFWIYMHGGQPAGIYKIAFCPNESNSPGNSRSYRLVVGKNTRQVYWRVFSSSFTYDQIISNGSVPLNEWHHVAATFDHGEAATYIDGQLDNIKMLSVSSIMNDVQPLFIGGLWSYCDADHWIPRLDGSIDEIAIYNRALPPEEIEQLYQAGAGGPIAHWKFDEGAGDIAYDSVGDNHGTLIDRPGWMTGKVGGALEFDGVDDYVSLSSNAVTTTEFTVSGWANHYGPGGGEISANPIFYQRDASTGNNHPIVLLRTENVDGNAGATIRSSNGSMQKLLYPRKNYHEWHHYAMTVSATDFVCYIDGIEVDRTPNNQQGDYVTSIDHVCIGKGEYTGNQGPMRFYFNGLIDEVAVWDRALSSEEVEQLYQAGAVPPQLMAVDIKPGSCPNPMNVKSKGVLPVAILGSDVVDANSIVATSVRLAGAAPVRNRLEDVAGLVTDPNECACTTDSADGFIDLALKFKIQEIVTALGELNHDDVITLPLTGVLRDESPIEGQDCVVIVGRHKPINKADINKDGLVNTVDMAIVAENWLQSSIIED